MDRPLSDFFHENLGHRLPLDGILTGPRSPMRANIQSTVGPRFRVLIFNYPEESKKAKLKTELHVVTLAAVISELKIGNGEQESSLRDMGG